MTKAGIGYLLLCLKTWQLHTCPRARTHCKNRFKSCRLMSGVRVEPVISPGTTSIPSFASGILPQSMNLQFTAFILPLLSALRMGDNGH